MTDFSFDLVQKNPIFRFFGTFNRPKTSKPALRKIATLFFGPLAALFILGIIKIIHYCMAGYL